MTANYRTFFGMTREAFPQDPALKDILETDDIRQVKERLDYVLAIGAIGLVTGEVGSGKSTAIRYVLSRLHPSEYQVISITALLRLHLGILSPVSGRTQHRQTQLVQSRHDPAAPEGDQRARPGQETQSPARGRRGVHAQASKYSPNSTPLPSSTMIHVLGSRSCL